MQKGAARMHSPTRFNWEDLRYFLAVARHGSTIAAGRALGVNQSTVQRRMAEFERSIGRPLLRREPTGYRLTAFAQGLVPFAESVENAALALETHLDTSAREAVGTVRLTCPEPMVPRITESGLIDRFQARHPGWRVDFVVSDRYLDLAKGEVDVALRSGDTDDPDVVGRKLADSLWAMYASPAYVAHHGRPESPAQLQDHLLVAFDESLAKHRAAQWLNRVAPTARVVARNNSVLGLLYAAKSGIGVAPLPTALGDEEPGLVRLFGPVEELSRIWRVLAHRDRRHAPGVAALFEFIVEEQERLRPILTG
jgi:DNA-binding transcriptional LysR family regulator